MRAAIIPCGEVRTVGQAIRSNRAKAGGLVPRILHPVAGWMPNIAMPFRFSGTPVVDPVAAPAVGQHTEEVLGEVLGYDRARLATLRNSGALSTSPQPPATKAQIPPMHETDMKQA